MSTSEAKRPADDNGIVQRTRRYLEQTRSELRKVVWPTRDEAVNLTVMVVVVLIVMAVILGVVDAAFTTLFRGLLG
ncbi:MAG: preprotein translocase subunit SecE [Anaerolineae bacterium]